MIPSLFGSIFLSLSYTFKRQQDSAVAERILIEIYKLSVWIKVKPNSNSLL